jgi:hypothetical protein
MKFSSLASIATSELSSQTRQPDDGVVSGMKSPDMTKYCKPTRPTALQPVLLCESKDKTYQLADPMGALLKIPSQDCVQVGSQLGLPLRGHDTGSSLRILASSLDTSRPYPRGGKYQGRSW